MDVGRCERGRGVRARGGGKGAGVWLVDGVDWRWRLRFKKVEALASGAGICLSGDTACMSVVVLVDLMVI